MSALRGVSRVARCGAFLACLLVVAVPWAGAQLGTQGTFSGTVRDTSNAVVAGAAVKVKNVDTGVEQTATTNEDGLYILPNLLPGHYNLEASANGFRTEIHNNLELTVSQKREVDFTLQVGAAVQSVTVTGEAPIVDTTSSSVSSLVNEKEVQNLPLNGRDYTELLYLSPSVSNSMGQQSAGRANPTFSIGGARPNDTRFMVDGTEFSGSGTRQNSLPNTSSQKMLGVDAIAEFSVSSNAGDATVGKAQGGQINLVTRSGTNDYHGTAYEFLRSDIFDARNTLLPTVPFLTRNNFGAGVGGPIKKDKAFFFFNFEQYRDREAQSPVLSAVPTDAVRGVGFGGVEQLPFGTVAPGNPCGIETLDPTTGILNNNGKPTQLNVAAVRASYSLLNFYPNNYSGAPLPVSATNSCPSGLQEAVIAPLQTATDSFVLGRVDYQLSQKQSLFARYLIQSGPRVVYVVDVLGQFPQYNPFRNQIFTFGDRYSFSNGWLNQFTASFDRGFYSIEDITSLNGLPGPIPSALTLIPGYTAVAQLGQINITSGPATIDGNASTPEGDQGARQIFEADDQVSKNIGKHFLQAGIQAQRILSNERGGQNFDGSVNFSSYLNFAEGIPNTYSGDVLGAGGFRSYRQYYIGAYVQDSYRVLSNLTLNVGLRWEFLSNPTEGFDRITQWYPVAGGDGACPGQVCYPTFPTNPIPSSFSEAGLVYPATNVFTTNYSGNWAPRVGFAWDVFGKGKTSLRGGFGVYYNQLQNDWRTPVDQSPPNLLPYVISNTNNAVLTWPTPGSLLSGVPAGQLPAGANAQPAPSTYQPNPPIPTLLQYNLTLQQQITQNTVLSVGYVGNAGYHENRVVNPQLPTPVLVGGQLVLPSASGLTSTTTGLNPALNPSATDFIYDSNSRYNSMQTTLEQRLSHGLQFKASFAWTKALADSADTVAIGNISTTGFVSLPRYFYGPDGYNVAKSFNLSGIYQLPLGTHQKAAGVLLNGWQFGWIYQQQSGLPFRLLDLTGQGFTAGSTKAAAGIPDINPAFTGPVILGATGTTQPYFNLNAFLPAPEGVLGNAGESAVLTGPGLSNVDVSLMKLFKLTERFNLQFRVDAFNAPNHTNWGLPSATLQQTITNTNAAGTGGCASTATFVCNISSVTPSPTAGLLTSTVTDPREFQFSLKLIF